MMVTLYMQNGDYCSRREAREITKMSDITFEKS